MMNTGGVQDFVNIKAASTAGGQANAARATEPLPDTDESKKVRQPPFRQTTYVSCGSEAGSVMSQDTLTDSIIDLRARVAEKRSRALRRLRGILNIAKVAKLSQRKPHVKRFQKAVRRIFYAYRMYKHMIRKRRYPMISNPRAAKAIYRLMMLVRMKLRNLGAEAWREKWLRAKRRVKGILNIQSIVKRERKERIEKLYRPSDEETESNNTEVQDQVTELDHLDRTALMQSSTQIPGQIVQPLTGPLRTSALAGKTNSIMNTQNRPSNVSGNFI